MKELFPTFKMESGLKLLVYGFLITGMFHSSLYVMVQWWENEDYTYGYLIPPIVLYLLWEQRHRFAKLRAHPSWVGILPLTLGILLFWLGELAGEFTTLYVASWFVLVGVLWVHFGWSKLKVIGFPIVFMTAMFPLPAFVHSGLTLRLKMVSSQLGVWILQRYGLSAYREGNVIDLGFTQLQVVDACSGLRYLFPLLIMSVLLAYFFKSVWWKRVLLVLSSVPLTIVTNSLRIALTGILYEIWGPAVAEDFFHGFSGWFIFMFALAALLLEIWVLSGFQSLTALGAFGSSGQMDTRPARNSNPPCERGDSAKRGIRTLFNTPHFGVVAGMLATTLFLVQGFEFREKIPPARSFGEFPTTVGNWSGKRDTLDQTLVDTLKFKDYAIVNYHHNSKGVNFYVAFYDSQRKGESIHSPETCLPGGGWEFRDTGSVALPLKAKNRDPMRVNKALLEKGALKQLSYFWFPQRDRVLTSAWELKFYNFWDALTRQRTDGALVRLVTPIYPDEDAAEADRRLLTFTEAIVPVLNEFLPK